MPAKMKIAPEHERAEHPPEQDPVLVLLRHREVRQDHGPDEHVVDGETLLDDVPGDVLAGGAPPSVHQITNVNERRG